MLSGCVPAYWWQIKDEVRVFAIGFLCNKKTYVSEDRKRRWIYPYPYKQSLCWKYFLPQDDETIGILGLRERTTQSWHMALARSVARQSKQPLGSSINIKCLLVFVGHKIKQINNHTLQMFLLVGLPLQLVFSVSEPNGENINLTF